MVAQLPAAAHSGAEGAERLQAALGGRGVPLGNGLLRTYFKGEVFLTRKVHSRELEMFVMIVFQITSGLVSTIRPARIPHTLPQWSKLETK